MNVLTILFFSAFTAAGIAQPAHDHNHDGGEKAAEKAPAQSHRAVGVVKSVDAARNTATIQHEAIQSLNWPGMTMTFKTKDAKTFAQLKPDSAVKFEFQQRGKDYVITSVNPAWGSCTPDCAMNTH